MNELELLRMSGNRMRLSAIRRQGSRCSLIISHLDSSLPSFAAELRGLAVLNGR
jgi:hypothetical protein